MRKGAQFEGGFELDDAGYPDVAFADVEFDALDESDDGVSREVALLARCVRAARDGGV